MNKFGLIGFPLKHSFSKKYFDNKFLNNKIKNVSYDNYEINDIQELKDLIKNNPEIKGLNVTIPYKKKIIPFLNKIDSKAKLIGAVNVVKINDDFLIGYNSDYLGFKQSLESWIPNNNFSALVFGSGGSSRAVIQVLKDMDITYTIVSRSLSNNYKTYEQVMDENLLLTNKLIINTTPLGMFPNVNSCPNISYDNLSDSHYVYDLVYNPEKTLFIKKCQEFGSNTKNGLDMLYGQADIAWNLWNK